ncbi:DUF4817 domain-containing protein [Trichonephila clavipes]|nr:DUF4817 domain-containing protein [Trichonephila clavipes]
MSSLEVHRFPRHIDIYDHFKPILCPTPLQKFQTLRGMKKGVGPMTVQVLKKLIQKFEETSSFYVQSGRGKKKVNSTLTEEVACLRAVFEELPEHWTGL